MTVNYTRAGDKLCRVGDHFHYQECSFMPFTCMLLVHLIDSLVTSVTLFCVVLAYWCYLILLLHFIHFKVSFDNNPLTPSLCFSFINPWVIVVSLNQLHLVTSRIYWRQYEGLQGLQEVFGCFGIRLMRYVQTEAVTTKLLMSSFRCSYTTYLIALVRNISVSSNTRAIFCWWVKAFIAQYKT